MVLWAGLDPVQQGWLHTAVTGGDGVCSAPQGPSDLSATGRRQEHDPSQLDESMNSKFSKRSSAGRGDMFSLDQLTVEKKQTSLCEHKPPSLSPASLGKGEAEQQLPSFRKVNHRCGTCLAKVLCSLNAAIDFFAWHLYFKFLYS